MPLLLYQSCQNPLHQLVLFQVHSTRPQVWNVGVGSLIPASWLTVSTLHQCSLQCVLQLPSSRASVHFPTSLNLADLVTCFSPEPVANVMQAEAWKVLYLEPQAALWLSLCSLLKGERSCRKKEAAASSTAGLWGRPPIQLAVDTWAEIRRKTIQLSMAAKANW